MKNRHHQLTLACVALLWLVATLASAQSPDGLWGSPFYRVQLGVSGSAVTGTFTSLDDPKAPPGKISGQVLPGGQSFTTTWTSAAGPDSGSFSTWLTSAGQGSLLTGYRWSDETQPTSFALHRAVKGELVAVIDQDSPGGPAGGTTGGATAGTTAATDANTYTMTSPAQGVVLADSYPRGDFEIEFEVTCTKPGTIFDTVGLNAAPVGSWAVTVSPDDLLAFNLWDGRAWGQLVSQTKIIRSSATMVRLWRQGPTARSFIGGKQDAAAALPTPLSGQPIYVGDFKGDEHWGAGHNISQGLLGTVRVVYLGTPRSGGTAAGTATAATPAAAADNRAARDACLSNLQNLGLGALLYSVDHDDKLPDADKWVDQVMPYLNKEAFLTCPSAPNLECGYAMNAALSGVNVGALENPAETVLFFDSHLGTRNAAGGREAVCAPARHDGGNCYAYADGYAKWLPEIPDLNPDGPAVATDPASQRSARVVASNSFDGGDQGWQVVNLADNGPYDTPFDPKAPDYQTTGGNPGGYVSSPDPGRGNFFWQAPGAFLGQRGDLYGGALRYDLKSEGGDYFDEADVVLVGAGLVLLYNQPENPTNQWRTFVAPLTELGWRKSTMTGAPATAEDFRKVLGSLTALRLRGEFRWGAEVGSLDNVSLCGPGK